MRETCAPRAGNQPGRPHGRPLPAIACPTYVPDVAAASPGAPPLRPDPRRAARRTFDRIVLPVLDEQVLLDALRTEEADRFDVLGFLGRRDSAHCAFLARELESGRLIVLHLRESATDGDDTSVEATTQTTLDSSVPDAGALCSGCRTQLRPWARFCHFCGTDVSGMAASSGLRHNRETLLSEVRARADEEGKFEILGDMTRSEGGGLVYFARERGTDRLVAFRLDRQPDESYDMKMTRVIKPPSRPARSLSQSGRISITLRPRADEGRGEREPRETAKPTTRRQDAAPIASVPRASAAARTIAPQQPSAPPPVPIPSPPVVAIPSSASPAPPPATAPLPPAAPSIPGASLGTDDASRRGLLVFGGIGAVLLLLFIAALL
jgi:hypothetical protein